MQTINAADLTVGNTLVPSGKKIVTVRKRTIGGKPLVLMTTRDRRGIVPLTLRPDERVTIR